jgi:hypothetical protein
VAKGFRSTSCAIGCHAKAKDADIIPCRVVIKSVYPGEHDESQEDQKN